MEKKQNTKRYSFINKEGKRPRMVYYKHLKNIQPIHYTDVGSGKKDYAVLQMVVRDTHTNKNVLIKWNDYVKAINNKKRR